MDENGMTKTEDHHARLRMEINEFLAYAPCELEALENMHKKMKASDFNNVSMSFFKQYCQAREMLMSSIQRAMNIKMALK